MSNKFYSEKLKSHVLAELEDGAGVRSLAKRYEPSEATIRIWKRQAAEVKNKVCESTERMMSQRFVGWSVVMHSWSRRMRS